jgi:hypothetical protein
LDLIKKPRSRVRKGKTQATSRDLYIQDGLSRYNLGYALRVDISRYNLGYAFQAEICLSHNPIDFRTSRKARERSPIGNQRT